MSRTRILGALVLLAVAGAVGYLGWLLVVSGQSAPLLEAQRVPRGDQEIAWINLATNAATWERFIEALHHAQKTLREATPPRALDIDDANAFPPETASIPEVSLQAAGVRGRLWIRYYKLTSEMNAAYWVRELAERSPAPLAIIGGTSSDQARDLARALRDRTIWEGQPPVLLIPTATADRVSIPGYDGATHGTEDMEDLMRIYRDRSFRFCFTNSQMAGAVTGFVWSQDTLRPAPGPVYLVSWKDDPYSQDLVKQFYEVFWPALPRGEDEAGQFALSPDRPPWQNRVPYSMGGYSRPNALESQIADQLLDELTFHTDQRPALLVLPAASQPVRRFLRALVQSAPHEVERFVVVTGDYIDFNSVCRDRNFAWPIQDLPLRLVFFSHRNPVEPSAGFTLSPEMNSSATDDLLVYSDLAQAVVRSAFRHSLIEPADSLVEQADALREGLRGLKLEDGQTRFDAVGNLRAGIGEFVTLLLPQRHGQRVLPAAELHVYRRSQARGGWELVRKLQLNYAGRGDGRAEP
jgi:hypothetical protein